VCIGISGGAEREAEGVRDEAGQGGRDQAGDGWHLGDGDGGDPRLIQSPLEQSDRLLADRSGRHEQRQIDLFGEECVPSRGDRALQDPTTVGDDPMVETMVGATEPMARELANRRRVGTG